MEFVQGIPKEKLKFADESHIFSKDLCKKKVLGMVNTRVYVKERTLHATRATLTILTTLVGEEVIVFDYRENSNTQWNFSDFLLECCKCGALNEGDYLVVDNVTVYNAWDSNDVVDAIVETAGIRLLFLPTYS